ncbi:hypothetical protein NEOLEDRAFT_1130201 [Neolentinus lepideus HHB14362 ss-1]|uniref:Uncharacterized protein n=1 Tax=Neolentinus lepideus HHB14362 ss-1 TaxID=1314782 RepID=A0A165U716_9AGAM|nr:hypothetical protein NEOLEDRAFT_1130201 [Neolentinus lepideus HHB14362 ss-1]
MPDHASWVGLLGPPFFGDLVAFVLYGLTTAQMLVYARGPHRDSSAFRSVIYFLWTIDTLHLVIATYLGYHYLITGRVRSQFLQHVDWSIVALIIVTVRRVGH